MKIICLCYTWTTTKGHKEMLLRFKRKIGRKMYGTNYYNHEEQKWEIRLNNQLNLLCKSENIVQFVKSTRLE